MVEFSIPVIWVEDGGDPLAGRLDLTPSGLRLDGGSRETRRTRDLGFADIASFRIGRRKGERIQGRQAVHLELAGGSSVSLAGFDRPGSLHELAERLEAAKKLSASGSPSRRRARTRAPATRAAR